MPQQGKGRRTDEDDKDPEDRGARLFWELQEACCLIMVAACMAATIRSQILMPGPAMVPACELFALAAILRVLLGSKQPPPPRIPRHAG